MSTLWIISELFPPDETSTAFILGEIANVMSEKYDVKVLCGPKVYDKRKKTDPRNKFALNSQVSVTHVQGVDLDKNTFWGKAIRFIVISKQLYYLAKKSITQGDKVLIVTNPAPVVALVSRLKKKQNFELNILVHDVFPENTVPAGLRLPKFVYEFLKRHFDRAYGRADQLIALGRDMKQVLEKKIAHFEHHPKVTIIENWADLDIVSPVETTRDTQKIALLYAGNIGRVQGLQAFLDCFMNANNKEVEFHLWGTGAEENNLKFLVEKNDLQNVLFHGGYLRSKQQEVLNDCNLALVTLSEGMFGLGVPSKSYNIMAAGKAILYIGDANSEIGLLVKEKQIGFVFEPGDRVGVTNFLASLSDDMIPVIKQMGIRAREVAEKEYAKGIILDKFSKAI